MPEMTDAGEDHGHFAFVGGGDHFVVAHGAARLNRGRRAGFGGGDQAVGKREKGVARHRAALAARGPLSCAFQTAMREASTRDICPAPIPRVRSGAA